MCKPASLGALLGLILPLCSSAVEHAAMLPAEVPINPEAGRGGWLVVTVRLESGTEVPCIVDTGSSGTLFDKSLEPELGERLGTTVTQSWGVHKTNNVYAAPKLYFGGAPLQMPREVICLDAQMSAPAGRPILGMLGYDCLRHYCLQLDFAAGKMRFLDAGRADKQQWGKAFPIVPLNDNDARPAVAANLFGAEGPHSLLDSGYPSDGWLMPKHFTLWTNRAVPAVTGQARSPNGLFGGETYPLVSLDRQDVESDGLGLRFLARHLVTLDFPNKTMYLLRQTLLPLPNPAQKTTRVKALEPLLTEVLLENVEAARRALAKIEQSGATEREKSIARKLVETLGNAPKPIPAQAPPGVTQLPLGDARPETAEVGWLQPAANRIPPNSEIQSPLLDCGGIYPTGLYAHSPSRYVFELGGKWKTLRGEAGLHTSMQGQAYGIVFAIKADGKELFRSAIIRGSKRPQYDLDVTGVKSLELLVEKAGQQNGGNWGLWLEPTLLRERN